LAVCENIRRRACVPAFQPEACGLQPEKQALARLLQAGKTDSNIPGGDFPWQKSSQATPAAKAARGRTALNAMTAQASAIQRATLKQAVATASGLMYAGS
jgi:hypothetical protein